MKLLFHTPHRLVLATVLVAVGCSKHLEQPAPTTPPSVSADIASIKQTFFSKGYAQQLITTQKDEQQRDATWTWQPAWESFTRVTISSTTSYTYIPLHLHTQPAVIEPVGVQRYLIVQHAGDSLQFRLATYLTGDKPVEQKIGSINNTFTNYTGVVLLRNLATKQPTRFEYVRGIIEEDLASKAKANITSASNKTQGTNACVDRVTCYWTGRCGPSSIIYGTMTSGLGICSPPGPNSGGCQGGMSWRLSGQERERECFPDPNPPPLPPSNDPVYVPNMPKTMPKQTGAGGCVPASLAQVKLSKCNTSGQTPGQVEGDMFTYGIQQYGMGFVNDGVPLSGMNDFINHFFNTTILQPAGNFQGAISAGYPVMIDIFSYMDGPGTAVYHSVVVTGYNPATNQIYYLDPGTGTTETGNASSLFSQSHYAIPITGCK